MADWWTYRLSDFLSFSMQTYYRLFDLYNQSIWPVQPLSIASGAAILLLIIRRPARQGRVISAILAAAWLWVAWSYHWQHYSGINWAARFYAMLFAAQAALLVWTGVFRNRLHFGAVSPLQFYAGMGLFFFALVVFPCLAPLQGRSWLQAELFAIAPDPTAIATLGVILLAADKTFWFILMIPLLWSVISAATLWTMGSAGVWVLWPSALTAIGLALIKTLGRAKSDAGKASKEIAST